MALITETGRRRATDAQPFTVKPVPNIDLATDFAAAMAVVEKTADLHMRAALETRRQPPTETQRESLETARDGFQRVSVALRTLLEATLADLEADMEAAGAPWTPGNAGEVKGANAWLTLTGRTPGRH